MKSLTESICIVLFTWALAWNFYHVSPNPEMKNWLIELGKWSDSFESFEPPPNISKVGGFLQFSITFFGFFFVWGTLLNFICGNRATDDEPKQKQSKTYGNT